MAKGSQLVQLKTAIADAGLSRKSQSKKRKRDLSQTRNKSTALKEISDKLNPFDLKVTKLKHDVGGRKVKGKDGKPALKNQAGIEQRKKSLLNEIAQRSRAGTILDRRFGESDPTMTPEERMLERFVKERQKTSRGVAFNLDDEDDLTHYGQSLSNMDDFDGIGLHESDDDDDAEVKGRIDAETVSREHFGGFDDESDHPDEPPRKKTKAEVMSEVIAKSKEHKYLRQMEKEHEDNVRRELDEGFDDIRDLLLETREEPADYAPPQRSGTDASYDRIVRELAFESRSKPKDRTKTEEEIAAEEKERLEDAERRRLRRMQGLDEDSGDEKKSRRLKKGARRPGGDDLDDDLVLGEAGLEGLGDGLQEDALLDDSDTQEVESGSHSSDSSSESDEEVEGSGDESDEANPPQKSDLPFVFPCPGSHDEWLEVIQDLNRLDIGTVVQRILALHHPSLGMENKEKLQIFNEVLIDHILFVTSTEEPDSEVVELLTPYIYRLSKDYPDAAAETFVEKLMLMEKNLAKGVAKDPTALKSKTWPGYSELTLLRLIGTVWSTSDMKHPVVGPTRLLMGAYLELGRIRGVRDIASGLFLCSLWLQYEALSKRLIPECTNFLLISILALAPTKFSSVAELPFATFGLDFTTLEGRISLNAGSKQVVPSKPNLQMLLSDGDDVPSEQAKVDLISLSLKLLVRGAELHKSLPGFVELYQPAVEVLSSVRQKTFPPALASECQQVLSALTNLIKFARMARKPLLLQEHKPLAIATYAPKFSNSSSSYLHNRDPDHERAAAAKLRREYKQEKKGAVKELRKDAKFLAQHHQEEQAEKDRAYKLSMRRAIGSIEGERAEEKRALKTKARDKKRSGKK